MLTCKDASHLVSQRLERPLSLRERWGLRIHLWLCARCRRFEQQMALMRQALRKLGERAKEEAANTELPAAARERISQALAERADHDHPH